MSVYSIAAIAVVVLFVVVTTILVRKSTKPSNTEDSPDETGDGSFAAAWANEKDETKSDPGVPYDAGSVTGTVSFEDKVAGEKVIVEMPKVEKKPARKKPVVKKATAEDVLKVVKMKVNDRKALLDKFGIPGSEDATYRSLKAHEHTLEHAVEQVKAEKEAKKVSRSAKKAPAKKAPAKKAPAKKVVKETKKPAKKAPAKKTTRKSK